MEEYTRRLINLETGHIYIKPKDPIADIQADNPYKVEDPTQFDSKKYNELKDLEFEYMPLMPTSEEANIMEAQQYANHLKEKELEAAGIDVTNLKAIKREKINPLNALSLPPEEEEKVAVASEIQSFALSYQAFTEKINNISASNLLHTFVGEKACSVKTIDKLQQKCSVQKVDKSKEQILSDIRKLKQELGLFV